MKVIHTVQDWIALRHELGSERSIGYVPTTGALHQGHQSLLSRSRHENDISILSIFINRSQFTEEEYLKYPRPLKNDMALAIEAKVDYLFMPEYNDFYPENNYQVSETVLSHEMEGKHEPGVFQRTLTNVLKLLLLIRPDKAYFGEKDYQQFLLIHGMAKAFYLNTQIILCESLRDANGLPLSSRNEFFSTEEKLLAQRFAEIFQNTALSTTEVVAQLKEAGIATEYMLDKQTRRFCAVNIGNIRIIDNRNL